MVVKISLVINLIQQNIHYMHSQKKNTHAGEARSVRPHAGRYRRIL
jgi:hypothetical protein